MTPVIETARLRLRGLRNEDFEPLYAGVCDPVTNRHIGGPMTREPFWEKLMRSPAQWALDGFGMFVVADRATDVAIGQTGCARFRRDIVPALGEAPEHSWIIGTGRGRGLGEEAARAALDWIEGAFAPARTVCLIHPANAASLRLADRIGYRRYAETDYHGGPVVLLERPSPAAPGL